MLKSAIKVCGVFIGYCLLTQPVIAEETIKKPPLMYQNSGVKFYTTEALYSSKWQQSLDIALARYQSLVEQPHLSEVFIVETSQQMSVINQQPAINKRLVLSMEMLNQKKKSYSSQFAVVNHELCHLWLIETLESKGLQQKKDPMGLPSYGHANAPDWLDESVATYCEIGDVEESRVNATFKAEPLHQFLNREHPVFAQMKQQIQAMLKNSNGQQVVITMETDDDSLFEYYQQSTWLRYFLIAQFGEEIYRQVIDKIVKEEDAANFLLNKFNVENWDVIDDKFVAFVKAGVKKQQQTASD